MDDAAAKEEMPLECDASTNRARRNLNGIDEEDELVALREKVTRNDESTVLDEGNLSSASLDYPVDSRGTFEKHLKPSRHVYVQSDSELSYCSSTSATTTVVITPKRRNHYGIEHDLGSSDSINSSLISPISFAKTPSSSSQFHGPSRQDEEVREHELALLFKLTRLISEDAGSWFQEATDTFHFSQDSTLTQTLCLTGDNNSNGIGSSEPKNSLQNTAAPRGEIVADVACIEETNTPSAEHQNLSLLLKNALHETEQELSSDSKLLNFEVASAGNAEVEYEASTATSQQDQSKFEDDHPLQGFIHELMHKWPPSDFSSLSQQQTTIREASEFQPSVCQVNTPNSTFGFDPEEDGPGDSPCSAADDPSYLDISDLSPSLASHIGDSDAQATVSDVLELSSRQSATVLDAATDTSSLITSSQADESIYSDMIYATMTDGPFTLHEAIEYIYE